MWLPAESLCLPPQAGQSLDTLVDPALRIVSSMPHTCYMAETTDFETVLDSSHPEGSSCLFWQTFCSQAVQQQPQATCVPPAPWLTALATIPFLLALHIWSA